MTVMARRMRLLAALCVGTALVAGSGSASAITIDLAKKCRALMIKAHPYKLPGTPGGGTAAAERSYFNTCVTRGGDMTDQPAVSEPTTSSSPQNAGSEPAESKPPDPEPAK